MIGLSVATFSIAAPLFVTSPAPSTDGTSGGRGRIIHLRDKNRVFTDRPTKVHIDDIAHIEGHIEVIEEDIHNLEVREQRMQHMLIAAKGLEQASNQLQRLETIQAQIALKRAILDDEQALKLILELI